MERDSFWSISVSGYGSFGFFGSEDEAEEMRQHKAKWEGGVGKKKRIPPTHEDAVSHMDWVRLAASRDYPQERKLLPRIEKYLKATPPPNHRRK